MLSNLAEGGIEQDLEAGSEQEEGEEEGKDERQGKKHDGNEDEEPELVRRYDPTTDVLAC